MDIVELTYNEFENTFNRNSITGKFEPFGLFLVLEDDGNYSAIDNSTGYPFVENFSKKDKAVSWLQEREMIG